MIEMVMIMMLSFETFINGLQLRARGRTGFDPLGCISDKLYENLLE